MTISSSNTVGGACAVEPDGVDPSQVVREPLGACTQKWLEVLGDLIGGPYLGLEVGSFEGRSARWFLENILTHPQSRLLCIDLFSLPPWDTGDLRLDAAFRDIEARFDANMRAWGHAHRVQKLKGQSSALLPQLERDSMSFVYVDGSHYAWDVLTDAVLSWPLLKKGGVLIFDDYGYSRVPPSGIAERPALGIDAFLSAFDGRYALLAKRYQVMVRKLE